MHATNPRCLVVRNKRMVSPSFTRFLSSLSTLSTPHYRNTPHRSRTPRRSPKFAASTRTDPCGSLPATATFNGKTRRRYATANSVKTPRSVAVLGGGLTGLTTAWYIARFLPDAKITLYEASKRLGGWIDAEEVEVTTPEGQKGTVCFQRGARFIKMLPSSGSANQVRYDDLVFIDMVEKLQIFNELEWAEKNEALDAYIYYPDHMVRLPRRPPSPWKTPLKFLQYVVDTFQHCLSEPLYKGFIPSVIHSMFKNEDFENVMGSCRNPNHDISIGNAIHTLVGRPDPINNIFSAMVHGIFGGDVWKLSLASSPFIHRVGMPYRIPVTQAYVRHEDADLAQNILRDSRTHLLAQALIDMESVWFKDGMSVLIDALIRDLEKNPNVTIKLGEPVTSVSYHEKTNTVAITTPSRKQPISYEKAISTIFAKTLADLCNHQLPSLEKSTAVTISLVNLWYPYPDLNHPHKGFGYLLPQSIAFDKNPEFVLGIIFDSDREWRADLENPCKLVNRGKDTIRGTKLTVMMGGHYWDSLPEDSLPDAATAVELAKKAVTRHMDWPQEFNDHVVASTKLCRDCIPQHYVGHAKTMISADGELEWAFKGKLAVAGPSYQPPGVLGSLRAAYEIAHFQAHPNSQPWSVGETGLRRFKGPSFKIMDKIMFPLKFDSGAYVTKDGQLMPEGGLERFSEQEIDSMKNRQ